jgi:hypothetical protein
MELPWVSALGYSPGVFSFSALTLAPWVLSGRCLGFAALGFVKAPPWVHVQAPPWVHVQAPPRIRVKAWLAMGLCTLLHAYSTQPASLTRYAYHCATVWAGVVGERAGCYYQPPSSLLSPRWQMCVSAEDVCAGETDLIPQLSLPRMHCPHDSREQSASVHKRTWRHKPYVVAPRSALPLVVLLDTAQLIADRKRRTNTLAGGDLAGSCQESYIHNPALAHHADVPARGQCHPLRRLGFRQERLNVALDAVFAKRV